MDLALGVIAVGAVLLGTVLAWRHTRARSSAREYRSGDVRARIDTSDARQAWGRSRPTGPPRPGASPPLSGSRRARSHPPPQGRNLRATGGRRPSVSLDDAVRAALGVEVRLGALGLDAPSLRLGRHDTVKVVISRDREDSRGTVAALVAGSQWEEVVPISTTAEMTVGLTGPTFTIRRLSPAGDDGHQVVSDTATWEFDVVPDKHGTRTLTVTAEMRLPVPGAGEKTVSVPSITQDVFVEVDRSYAAQTLVREHWKWVAATSIAAVSAGAALAKVFQA